MTPADRRWRALAKWLREQSREYYQAYWGSDEGNVRRGARIDQIEAVQREMRRLSRAPRARRRKAPHADEKQSHPYDLSVGRKGFKAWAKR